MPSSALVPILAVPATHAGSTCCSQTRLNLLKAALDLCDATNTLAIERLRRTIATETAVLEQTDATLLAPFWAPPGAKPVVLEARDAGPVYHAVMSGSFANGTARIPMIGLPRGEQATRGGSGGGPRLGRKGVSKVRASVVLAVAVAVVVVVVGIFIVGFAPHIHLWCRGASRG